MSFFIVSKSTDQSTNSTTMIADNDLHCFIDSNRNYNVSFIIYGQIDSILDSCNWSITGPGSLNNYFIVKEAIIEGGVSYSLGNANSYSYIGSITGVNGRFMLKINILVQTNIPNGNLQFNFSSGLGGAIKILAGSIVFFNN